MYLTPHIKQKIIFFCQNSLHFKLVYRSVFAASWDLRNLLLDILCFFLFWCFFFFFWVYNREQIKFLPRIFKLFFYFLQILSKAWNWFTRFYLSYHHREGKFVDGEQIKLKREREREGTLRVFFSVLLKKSGLFLELMGFHKELNNFYANLIG